VSSTEFGYNLELVSHKRVLVRLGSLLLALGAWAVVAACSSSGGRTPPDASGQDSFSLDFKFGDVPVGCPPGVGNDKNVGSFCSKGGGQCGAGLICACDSFNGLIPPEDTPCFCTIPILGRACNDPMVPAGLCGQSATCCSYMQLGSICVPDICLGSMTCPVF
jgi:hypothetical protein